MKPTNNSNNNENNAQESAPRQEVKGSNEHPRSIENKTLSQDGTDHLVDDKQAAINMLNGYGNQNNDELAGGGSSSSKKVRRPAADNHLDKSKQKKRREEQEKESVMQRTLAKLNKRHRRLRRKFNKGLSRYTKSLDDELAHSERQNSVQTRELFKYAQVREKFAICLGVMFMFYAASWQPISVFILATMASLMGQYAKQSSWLNQMLVVGGTDHSAATTTSNHVVNASRPSFTSGGGDIESSSPSSSGLPFFPSSHHQVMATGVSEANVQPAALGAYSDELPMLAPLHSFVRPIFDHLGSSALQHTFGWSSTSSGAILPDQTASADAAGADATSASTTVSGEGDEVKLAVEEILRHESHQFLRRSFEINASAFLLGLSQLAAFFLGMSLITWVAKRQASRLKILYFKSCLHQEVTWYESIDSASGSGSSLNALVDKYEDGIGPKLALLCYFLGHVTLFACTAFYQMLSLASFCTCFVITVGLIIIYLSGGQAVAIGEHALFAKRSLQLAEEILASIRTVFAFNGQQKELTRYQLSLEPVYRKSLIKHLYTALNTSLSKFSIFACFSAYCFYARHLFPPYSDGLGLNKATVLAVMRGGEVSIVNILISIPFMEALQQSKGSIARIYAAIERRSKINPSSERGARPAPNNWQPSISFRMVQFGYADRAGPTQRRRSTLMPARFSTDLSASDKHHRRTSSSASGPANQAACLAAAATVTASEAASSGGRKLSRQQQQLAGRRRRSIIDELADEFANDVEHPEPAAQFNANSENSKLVAATHKNESSGANRIAASGQQHHHHHQQPQQQQQTGGAVVTNEPKRKSAAGGLDNITTTRRINNNNSYYQHNSTNPSGVNKMATVAAAAVDYQQQDKRILNRFNLEIKAGQSVALVGPSGSGKSTVLSLLLRLYDITGGQLLIGQHNIKDLNIQWLRNQIGVVTQEPRLFDMSIADNIRLGLPKNDHKQQQLRKIGKNVADELINDRSCDSQVMQQVIEASKAAGAHNFIIKLPQGYSTRVGSGGVQLSGGQKQRIAIARALIRRPSILLLDESTSALDTESETQVLRALQKASAGRTTITVAHRLRTVQHVDLIVVMSQGQVIECGTHDELMYMEAGTYRKMYQDQIEANEGQKRRYRDGPGAAPLHSIGAGGKSSESKGGLLDQIEFVTLGAPDHNGSAAKSCQDEKKLDLLNDDGYDDNDDSDGGSSSSSNSSSYSDTDEEDDDDEHDGNDDDDEGDDDEQSSSDNDSSSLTVGKPDFTTLWQFVEPPKWTSLAAILVCLLAGLVLPMNLIAHSYLFSAFAYNELEQIGDYLYFFGLVLLSFSTFVLIVTFLQVMLPGYVGEKISVRLRARTMDSFLHKPMFYFDMDANSAGSLCDRLNSYISNIQNIAGTRIATILEAVSTLMAGAFFGFGQNLTLSMFCLSFALLVLITTVIESRIVQQESSIHQKYDAQLAHLMADSLSNIKTIASLNKETFFIDQFSEIIQHRERGTGRYMNWLRTFLTSLKFVMPALSWSASMYFGSYLLTLDRIDLQTIFIVCPVVLFAVNDTFRALVFLPELLKARKSIERLYRMNREFSPQVLQTLSLAQQLEQQNRLHLEQMAAAANAFSSIANQEPSIGAAKANTSGSRSSTSTGTTTTSITNASTMQQLSSGIHSNLTNEALAPRARGADNTRATALGNDFAAAAAVNNGALSPAAMTYSDGRAVATAERGAATLMMNNKAKKSISFVEPASMNKTPDTNNNINNDGCRDGSANNRQLRAANEPQTQLAVASAAVEDSAALAATRTQIINRRVSNLAVLPTYMRRKSSRLNSLIPRYQSRGRIEFNGVEFAYPNRPSALVLDGFSLSVSPGESVALVGGSGCGKSTCVSILEKFYDYHGGKVTVDGYDLRLVDPNWVRSQIGLVSQEPTLLSYTIGDNIRYGDNGRFVSMDEVVEAARTANIHDFIMSLPDQYDTELSTSAYSSSQLSGGQRQRIAIARALVRNAPILIFDEATSALDPSNEAIVQDALNKARKGRTSLTIAHRLSTIKDADKIVVLNEGKVVEIGKHDELINRPNGHYRNLWEKHEGGAAAE